MITPAQNPPIPHDKLLLKQRICDNGTVGSAILKREIFLKNHCKVATATLTAFSDPSGSPVPKPMPFHTGSFLFISELKQLTSNEKASQFQPGRVRL